MIVRFGAPQMQAVPIVDCGNLCTQGGRKMIRNYRAILCLAVLLALASCVLCSPVVAGQDVLRAQLIPCATTGVKPAATAKAWLGVTVQELSDELREVLNVEDELTGVVVADVTDGSPADEAGIRHGDVILSVSGKEMETPDDLVKLIQSKKPGADVTLSILRDGAKLRKTAVLGKAPAKKSEDLAIEMPESKMLKKEVMPPVRQLKLEVNRGYLGANVLDIGEDLGGYFGVREGVLVTEVLEGGAGQKAGLRPGDVITAVDGKKVADRKELIEALQRKEEGEDVEVAVIRKSKPLTLTVTLEKGPFVAWMEGIGDKGEQFKDQFVMPRLENLGREADLERRLDEVNKKLEKVEERLKRLDEKLKER